MGAVKPLAIWTEGLLAEGWAVIGFDNEAHAYDGQRYPAQLVLQDVLTLHGSQFRTADLIVASPPCQFFSYTAMPWTRAKALAAEVRADAAKLAERLALFRACFRIQREACEAAGRHIPLVVENVKGAQPWVGRAAWAFGSYFLWGDVPALMPIQRYHSRLKVKAGEQRNINRPNFTGTRGWDDDGLKAPGGPHIRSGAPHTKRLTNPTEHVEGRKNDGGSWFNVAHDAGSGKGANPDGRPLHVAEGRKGAGAEWFDQNLCKMPSGSSRRKAASAKIAKIPLVLSSHIGRVYLPREVAA